LDTIAVLLVDDNPELADLTATYLEREDEQFDVTTVATASEALDRLSESTCDCIVSDYEMPGQNGIEFLTAVREAYADLPFILYTGKGSETVASDAISSGVTDYLQKESGTSQYTVLANRIRNVVEQYRSAAALKNSKKRLSLLIEQSPIGVLEYNEDFEIVRLNEKGESILGYSEEELLGDTWERLVTEESYQNVDAVTDALAEARGGYHSVDRNVRKDGEEIICEWHNRVITDEHDDVVAIISLFQDITDRKERQRELERYEAYLEGSTDIITVLDDNGQIQYQSPSVTRILGFDRGELVGQNGFEFVHPDDRESTLEVFERLSTGAESRVEAEARFRTASGEWRWLDIRGTDYRDNPDIEGIVVNSRDITARKQHEQELRESSARLKALFDESPDMINVHDIDGNIVEPNPRLCEQTGFSKAELLEMKVWDLDVKLDPAEAKSLWQEMDEDAQRKITSEYHRKNGSTFPVEIHVRRHDADGEQRFIAISRDISERRQREEQLEQFASVVSHDLKNPLKVAEGHLELARETGESRHFDSVQQAHERMFELIENLLTLSREGEQVGALDVVDVGTVAESCWQSVETADATLRTDSAPHIHANRERLKQLLENLIGNAVEHGGTAVTVTVGRLPGGFYVEDDGAGIAIDDQEELFRPGYSGTEGGTGFGLSIAKQVTDAHDWEITPDSSDAGGARFEITGVEIEPS
jgi:PAS domain S-box-containing protein